MNCRRGGRTLRARWVCQCGFEVEVAVGEAMLVAELFALGDGGFAEVALEGGIAFALEDAAAGEAVGIDGALAVYAVGADAGGYGF